MSEVSTLLVGYERLWARLINHADRELRARSPEGAAELSRAAADATVDAEALEKAVELGKAIASEFGLTLTSTTRRALEEGVSAYDSVAKLRRVYRRITRLQSLGTAVDADEADAVLDLWWTYVHRHLETTATYLTAASGVLLPAGAARSAFRRNVRQWSDERRNALARGRQEVAHGNTVFIRAIDEDDLWEPMILSGFAHFPALEEMVRPRPEPLVRRLELWASGLREVTARAIAEGDAYCQHLADAQTR